MTDIDPTQQRQHEQISAMACQITGSDYSTDIKGIASWFDNDDPAYSMDDFEAMAELGLSSLLYYFDEHEPENANAIRYGLTRINNYGLQSNHSFLINYPERHKKRV